MGNFEKISSDFTAALAGRSRRAWRISNWIKGGFVIAGSAVVVVCQLMPSEAFWHGFSLPQFIGIIASGIVALGGFALLILEQDAASELSTAGRFFDFTRQLVDEKRDHQAQLELLNRDIERFAALNTAVNALREFVEQAAAAKNANLQAIVGAALKSARPHLLKALDFRIGDSWTICVYKAEPAADVGKAALRLFAHEREIDCEKKQARLWTEGEGNVGQVYAKRKALIIADMLAAEMKKACGPWYNNTRLKDDERYRSLATVPILIGRSSTAWGVVVGTTSKPGHFNENPNLGLKTHEPILELAAMIALAAAVCNG